MAIGLLVLTVFWLAYSNGANDNFKGVATLYGSGTASFRRSLGWATVATAAGSLVSVALAGSLVRSFSGKGLVPDALTHSPALLIAVGAAAAATILLATRLGMPTSTTHALIGALVGAALVADGGVVRAAPLIHGFAQPLLLSPVIALAGAAALYAGLHRLETALGITGETCVCVGSRSWQPVRVLEDGSAVLATSGVSLDVDRVQNCVKRYAGRFIGIDVQTSVDTAHYASAAAVCFSRAVNDTPKIAALMLATGTGQSGAAVGLAAAAMAAGGLLNAGRVAETMSKRIADFTPGQGLSANLVTAALVLFASKLGLPVSTTHVACGAILGIGLVNRTWRWKTVTQIAAAWVTTLPLAAILGALLFGCMRGR